MRRQGRITRWDDQKGYGHISWHGGGEPVFVHVKSFRKGARHPIVGDIVTYELGKDPLGRPRAERVEYPRPVKAAAAKANGSGLVPSMFAVSLIALSWFGRVPAFVLLVYFAMSIVTVIAYGLDKAAARRGDWRTPETKLLMLGLLCGWPGAVWAQQRLRHKARKLSFQYSFWLTVAINLMALWVVMSPAGLAFRERLTVG